MSDSKYPVPESTQGDANYAAAKGLLGAIPVLGGLAAEVFQFVVQPPIEQRRGEWMAKIGEDLQRLQERGVKLDDLQSNKTFISAVMHASQIAIRTHQEEKIEALRNALQNVALGASPDETRMHMFLQFVDSLSVMHMRILAVFRSPPNMDDVMAGGLDSVIEKGIPSLRGQRDLYDQLWNELVASGLLEKSNLHATISGHGLSQKRTSKLGDEFLAFISRH